MSPKIKETRKRSRSGTPSLQNPDMVDSAGDQSSERNPAAKTFIHEDRVYYVHPLYTNYGASKDGYIVNRKRLKPTKGRLRSTGYLDTCVLKKETIVSSHNLGIN